MLTIDLNCDMGESFGSWRMGMDDQVMPLISSANIACGWHAGDALVMDRTVQLAASRGVAIGAHPGYPDLQGFGRRRLQCTGREVRAYVMYQVGALMAFCTANGVTMAHVKPHGSLYNTAASDEETALAVAEGIAALNPSLLSVGLAGPRGELVVRAGKEFGLRVIREAFPDRAYAADGDLVPRNVPGAVLSDPQEVAQRALMMARDHRVLALDGTMVELHADTLCVHGDNPAAVDLVRSIRSLLQAEGISIVAMGSRP
jgi:5-oxoprolinase (ATP-hydrolysing) subunit A